MTPAERKLTDDAEHLILDAEAEGIRCIVLMRRPGERGSDWLILRHQDDDHDALLPLAVNLHQQARGR